MLTTNWEHHSMRNPWLLSCSLGLVCACAGVDPQLQEESTASSPEALAASYTTVTFQDGTDNYAGTSDTYLNQGSPITNFGNASTLHVEAHDRWRTHRTLSSTLRFDVSTIPSNAVVVGATLMLYVTDPSATRVPIYGLKRPWIETEATWRQAGDGTRWDHAGALGKLDRDTAPLGFLGATSRGSNSTRLNANGIAELQGWVAAPSSNYGFIIADTSMKDGLAFYSKETREVSRRPKLVVTFTLPTPSCLPPGCCTSDAACDDGILCTADACVAGVCASTAVSGCCNEASECDDGNVCTTDLCVEHGCSHNSIAGCCLADSDCSDGDRCTADTCLGNACVFSPIAGCCSTHGDCDDAQACTRDICVEGACTYSPIYGGACGCRVAADCDDGVPCTIDACMASVCTNTVASCKDDNPGSVDECVDGYCRHTQTATTLKAFRNGENGYLGMSDTKIAQNDPTANYESGTILVADGDEPSGSGNDVAVLLKWGELGIPTDATVTRASLTLYIGGGANASSASSYPIYAMNRPWTAAQATWELADGAGPWGTKGAQGELDRDALDIASTPTSMSGSTTIPIAAAGLSEIQSWVRDPTLNNGFILASSSNTDGLSLYSSEYATVSYRPMLSIAYTTQQTTVDPEPVGSGWSRNEGPSYGFFVYSDSHVDSATGPEFAAALAQMNDLKNAASAPPIIAAISLGDHTENGLNASWDWHTALSGRYFDAAATSFGGTLPRYLAVPGNHDVLDSTNWYGSWSAHLPGLASLGGTSSFSAGVYYSFTHENALFVGLDTNKATNTSSSYSEDPQVKLLRSSLVGSTSPFKFVFYHAPAFYCGNGGLGASGASLAFIDLAAQNNVDVVFNGHSHVYSRTCRMTMDHACTGNSSGTVQVEVGTVGASDARLRGLKTTSSSVSGYDSRGVRVSDSYTCVGAGGYDATLGSQRTFCYVNVQGCSATVSCYQVGNPTPVDSWTLNHCL